MSGTSDKTLTNYRNGNIRLRIIGLSLLFMIVFFMLARFDSHASNTLSTVSAGSEELAYEWNQTDETWNDINSSIDWSKGCAIVAVAEQIARTGLVNVNNTSEGFNPGTMSLTLDMSDASINWQNVCSKYPGMEIVEDRTYHERQGTIFSYFPVSSEYEVCKAFTYFLSNGYLPVVEGPGSTTQHFVAAVYAWYDPVSGDGDVICMNPANGSLESLFSVSIKNHIWNLSGLDAHGSPSGYGSCVLYHLGGARDTAWRLDVYGLLNNENSQDLGTYGTVDVYINGILMASNVNDYCVWWPAGTLYEIVPHTRNGSVYNGLAPGSAALSGVISNSVVNIGLSYSPSSLDDLTLADVPDGVYAVKGLGSGSWLTAPESSGTEAYIQSGNMPTNRQLWHFTRNENSSYTIVNIGTGQALDVKNGDTYAGVPVITYQPNGTRAQNWYIVQDGSGYLQFISQRSFYALDVKNGDTGDGAPLQQYPQNQTRAQYWQLINTVSFYGNHSGKNYLIGSDFSAALDPSRWASRNTDVATIQIDDSVRHNGYSSLRIDNSAAGSSGNDLIFETVTQGNNTSEGFVGDDKPMTLSFWAKSSQNGTGIHFRWGYDPDYESVNLTTEWARYSVRMDKTSAYNSSIHPYVDQTGTVWLAELQLEDGTTATDFVPEDTGLYTQSFISCPGVYSLPSDPTWTGHSFLGWYTSASGGIHVTELSPSPIGKTTLYAHWDSYNDGHSSENTYTVQYKWNDYDTVFPAQEKVHDVPLVLNTEKPEDRNFSSNAAVTLDAKGGTVDPTKIDGFKIIKQKFLRWNTAKDGNGIDYEPGDTYTENADVTLYAKYDSSVSYIFSQGLPTAVRDGYYFLGWADSADSLNAAYLPGENRVRSQTIYAVWATPDLILPSALTTIGEEAFTGGAFSFVKLSENTTTIGHLAFADCPNLKYIYIPKATTSIDRYAFAEMNGLTILGKTGSTAETYAQQRGFDFIPMA